MEHQTTTRLEAGLGHIRQSPREAGTVALIVARPAIGARTVLDEAHLDVDGGLIGDNWLARGEGSANREAQLTVMNSRVIALIAREPDRWALAGDQIYVDLDLSDANLPPGTRLSLGDAVIEVSAKPHRGCAKFSQRFGRDALRFVSTPDARALRLRGVNARIVGSGTVRRGDTIRKL